MQSCSIIKFSATSSFPIPGQRGYLYSDRVVRTLQKKIIREITVFLKNHFFFSSLIKAVSLRNINVPSRARRQFRHWVLPHGQYEALSGCFFFFKQLPFTEHTSLKPYFIIAGRKFYCWSPTEVQKRKAKKNYRSRRTFAKILVLPVR